MQSNADREPTTHSPAQRRDFESTVTRVAGALVLGIARHWLAIFNLAWGTYVVLPFLAPVLMSVGLTAPARVIYAVYSIMCHQLPDHSYFLFGPEAAPNQLALEAAGMAAGLGPLAQRQFVGNEFLGFKVAICQRDVAIYGSVLAAGLLFALVRKRLPMLSFRWYLLLLIPMALDGGTQLFGWRESTWLLRTLTGALFGAASVWLAYPYIDEAMQDVVVTEEQRQFAAPA
ncbi:MAG: hypothetical protein DCC55_33100 [Chloroflexi bacterium]|nr:MAG: hypothetical protein DCC55_33100 [Chloroflexota bacterium]